MEEYLNSFVNLDTSDFIKQYHANIRYNVTTDPEYIQFVQKHSSRSFKYMVKPILYRSYNDPEYDLLSYVMTVHDKAMNLIQKYCVQRQMLMRHRVKSFHSNLGNDYLNIEKQILS